MVRAKMCLFNVETPFIERNLCQVSSPFRLSGWIIPIDCDLSVLDILVNDKASACATTGSRRPDVAAAFPDAKQSLWSGFVAEVFLDEFVNSKVTIAVRARFNEAEEELLRFQAGINGLAGLVQKRTRSWLYTEILACPFCDSGLAEEEGGFICRKCGSSFCKRRGVPVFAKADEIVCSKLLETNPTNPSSEEFLSIIRQTSPGLVLDLGAGNPSEAEHFSNVVFHEIVQYTHTDVVSTCDKLPYKDGGFSAVISKAAFEHMARPWEMADEIYRVLRPGGRMRVDTAFMYPLHGDPYHYFNMTVDGIKELFRRFDCMASGVKDYQRPSYSLRAQIDIILDHIRSRAWQERLKELRALITDEFDLALDEKGLERLAAGVFFEGMKPF